MHSSHSFAGRSAVLDENNIISCVGLAPVMGLAKQIGLTALLTEKVAITAPRIKSGSAKPVPKRAALIAGMCVGADSIDDIDLLRAGGRKAPFGGSCVPDPATKPAKYLRTQVRGAEHANPPDTLSCNASNSNRRPRNQYRLHEKCRCSIRGRWVTQRDGVG